MVFVIFHEFYFLSYFPYSSWSFTLWQQRTKLNATLLHELKWVHFCANVHLFSVLSWLCCTFSPPLNISLDSMRISYRIGQVRLWEGRWSQRLSWWWAVKFIRLVFYYRYHLYCSSDSFFLCVCLLLVSHKIIDFRVFWELRKGCTQHCLCFYFIFGFSVCELLFIKWYNLVLVYLGNLCNAFSTVSIHSAVGGFPFFLLWWLL